MAEYGSMDNIRTKIIKGDLGALRVKHMGDNMVLLTRYNGEGVDFIVHWSNDQKAKVVWIIYWKLPLSFWNEKCFSKVVLLLEP